MSRDTRDLAKRLDDLEESIAGSDEEIVIRDEVVATPWESSEPDTEAPAAGVSVTRHYRDKDGNWISEGDG